MQKKFKEKREDYAEKDTRQRTGLGYTLRDRRGRGRRYGIPFFSEQQRFCARRGRRSRDHYLSFYRGQNKLVYLDDGVQFADLCFGQRFRKQKTGLDVERLYGRAIVYASVLRRGRRVAVLLGE